MTDDLDRDDEYLDEDDENEDDDEVLDRFQSRRPPVRPFSAPGSSSGSGSFGSSSSRPAGGSGSSSGGRDTSGLPGNRPGGFQSRYGSGSSSSSSGGSGPFGSTSSGSGSSGSSRPGASGGAGSSGSGRTPFYSGVIGGRRDDEDEEEDDEPRNERSSGPPPSSSSANPARPSSSPFRSASSSSPPPGSPPPTRESRFGASSSGSGGSGSSSSSSAGSSGGSSQRSGGGLGGLRSKLPGGGGSKPDNKPAQRSSSGGSGGSSGGSSPLSGVTQGLGNLRSKLPGGGDKKPASRPTSSASGGAGKSGGSSPLSGVTQGLGNLRSKLPFGGKEGSDQSGAGRSSTASGASSRPGGGSSGAFGSRSGGNTPSSSAASRSGGAAKASGGGLSALTSRLPFIGQKEEKPARATTREKLERASKAPRIDESGLSLDNKLDILGVGLVLASLALFFSSMSATKGQLTEAINTFLSQLFGIGAIAVPLVMFAAGMWLIIRHFGDEAPVLDPVRLGGIVLIYVGSLLLFQFLESFNPAYAGINLTNPEELRLQLELSYMLGKGGGWLGSEIYYWLVTSWTEAGMIVFMIGMYIIGFMLLLRISAAELAIFVISIWRSFADAQRRRSQTREARARLRAAELAAAAESRVSISKPAAAELPAGQSPALPTGEAAEARPIPITMGGRTVTAFYDGNEAVDASGQPQGGNGQSAQPSIAARLFSAVPLLGSSSESVEAGSNGEQKSGGMFSGLFNRGDKPSAEPTPAAPQAAAPTAEQPASAQAQPQQPPKPAVTPFNAADSTRPAPQQPTAPAASVQSAPAETKPEDQPARVGDLLRSSGPATTSPFGRPTTPASQPRPSQPVLDDDEDDEDDDEQLNISAARDSSPTPQRPGESAWARPSAQGTPSPQTQNLSVDERRERLNAIRSGQGAQPTGTSQPTAAPNNGGQPQRPQQPAASAAAPPAQQQQPRQPIVFGTLDEDQNGNNGASRPSAGQPQGQGASPAFGRPSGPPAAPAAPPRKRRDWKLPDHRTLLSSGSETDFDREVLLKAARTIEETLQSFGAPGRVVEVNTGPVITQFGVEPDYLTSRSGKKSRVKVGAIAQLDKDLQLALGAKSIRIEAPVPGKGYVGIEVPNEEASLVSLRDVMESDQFRKIKSKSPLALALGQSVDGTPISADLSAMPHLLVAGTTGSGKSVLVNAIICSILINNPPDKVKFIMVDPKRVELTGYNGIPHLVAPVVVDLERTVGVLKWVTREMDERYKQFSTAGARNIEDFNKHLPSEREPMPYIVVIIDELADLMMMAPDETERVITRIAALARATGIHLVIATQRPSVDVVTGLIKANFPARVAFAVAGGVDSRVILDQPGAERLLGKGDMLYLSGNAPAPLRLQGVFLSDDEIANITRYWKRQNAEQPEPHIIKSLSVDDAPEEARAVQAPAENRFAAQAAFWDVDDDDDGVELHDRVKDDRDELYDQAVEMVRRLNKASVSLLQRRLRIGYTRAARLIDMMEAEGIVGPAQEGSKPREVLPPQA